MDPPRDGWQARAACRDEDPELFFPVGNLGPAARQEAEAKAVCARCPVAAQCLAYAMRTGQDYGIWGGMTPDERRALARHDRRSFRIEAFDETPSRQAAYADAKPSPVAHRAGFRGRRRESEPSR